MNVVCPICKSKAQLKIDYSWMKVPIPSKYDLTCLNCHGIKWGSFKLHERLIFYVIFFISSIIFLDIAFLMLPLSLAFSKILFFALFALTIIGCFYIAFLLAGQYLIQLAIVKIRKQL